MPSNFAEKILWSYLQRDDIVIYLSLFGGSGFDGIAALPPG